MEEIRAALHEIPPHHDCFGCSAPGEGRLHPRFLWDDERGRLGGTVHLGPGCQGPPGHAHGGSLSTVLDEAMGAAVWCAGHPVVCASLTVNFRQMVPLDSALEIDAAVERIDGRKVFARGSLRDAAGTTVADSSGLYVVIDPAQIGGKVPGTGHPYERYVRWRAERRH